MSATNSTTNYHLPIFIGTDIPSWLVDWNNAMTNLDNAVGEALLAGQTAEADVKTLESTVTAIQTAVSTLTGCSNSEIAELNDMGASQDVSDIDATDVSLSNSAEDQNRVYKQVSERKLLNLASLEACESNDITQVNDFMSKVDNQLVGYTKTKDGVIDESYINYLLSLFQVTPYYWQKSSMTIRGMDASSRDIIVDVTHLSLIIISD